VEHRDSIIDLCKDVQGVSFYRLIQDGNLSHRKPNFSGHPMIFAVLKTGTK